MPLSYTRPSRADSIKPACEPHDCGSVTGAGSLIYEICSRYRRFYSWQAQGLRKLLALPPIHPEEHYLRADRRRQLIYTISSFTPVIDNVNHPSPTGDEFRSGL